MKSKLLITTSCFLLTAFFGCATAPKYIDKNWYKKEEKTVRKDIIESAYKIKKMEPSYNDRIKIYDQLKKEKVPYIMDCSGFVRAVYVMTGINQLENNIKKISGERNVQRIWKILYQHNKIYSKNIKPVKGDIIFFDNTYDTDRNPETYDKLTHIGIVENVDSKGTIKYIHSSVDEGVIVSFANRRYPRKDTLLRKRRKKDPKGTKYHSGELINSFGTFFNIPKKKM
ncbi:MAG: NlpC/P60 family protein [Elusimicrobiota bacterium]